MVTGLLGRIAKSISIVLNLVRQDDELYVTEIQFPVAKREA